MKERSYSEAEVKNILDCAKIQADMLKEDIKIHRDFLRELLADVESRGPSLSPGHVICSPIASKIKEFLEGT